MLQNFIKTLCNELLLSPVPERDKEKTYFFQLNKETVVSLRDLEPGVAMQAQIASCPEERREELFIYLMRANLLGQGTGGARIGLSTDEKILTLALSLPYEMDYKAFKESLEEFVNYLTYWRDELNRWVKEKATL